MIEVGKNHTLEIAKHVGWALMGDAAYYGIVNYYGHFTLF